MTEKKPEEVNKNRSVSDETLIGMFDGYDNTKACGFVTEKALMQLSHGDRKTWDFQLADKIKKIKSFISNIQSKLNQKGKSVFGMKYSIEKNVFFYADPNMPQVYTKIKILRAGSNNVVPLSLNIPLDKLIKMPALEIYSILSASTFLAVNQSLNGTSKRLSHIDFEKLTESDKENFIESAEEKIEHHENKRKAVIILAAYLEKVLPRYFAEQFKEFDDIADLVAMQIVDELSPEKLDEMMEPFFDLSTLTGDAKEKVDEFLKNTSNKEENADELALAEDQKELIEDSRIDYLYKKSMQLWDNPEKELQALNVNQQYQSLMSDKLRDQFANLVKQDYLSASNINVIEFCKNYADSFMKSNGLKPIKLTFNSNSSDLGTFIDSGTSQRININIKKIAKCGSVSTLVTTLSHELTHAVDASMNKISGNRTADGYGLHDNISNDISASTLKSKPPKPEYQLLIDLNKYCYRINPNERKARFGELSGIKLLQEISVTEKEKTQLDNTIKKYKDYQSKTLEVLKNLNDPAYFSDLEKKVEDVLKSNIADEDKDMFVERIEYIKDIMKNQKDLDNSMENVSLKEVSKDKENDKIMKELEEIQMQK